MKKLIVFLLLSFITAPSCKNRTGHSIQGKWKPFMAELKSISDSQKKDLLSNVIIEFTSDGKFFNSVKKDETDNTYVFDEKNNILTIGTTPGHKEIFSISWENDKMVMTNDEGTIKLKPQQLFQFP